MNMYDHVIVDSPSVESGPDSRILAALCDASLLVIREGQTNQRAAQQAVAALGSVGANLIGVVLNRGPLSGRNERISGLVHRWPGSVSPRLESAGGIGNHGGNRLTGVVPVPFDE